MPRSRSWRPDYEHNTLNRMLFSESSYLQSHVVQSLKQVLVTVAVVTVCWSFDVYNPSLSGGGKGLRPEVQAEPGSGLPQGAPRRHPTYPIILVVPVPVPVLVPLLFPVPSLHPLYSATYHSML